MERAAEKREVDELKVPKSDMKLERMTLKFGMEAESRDQSKVDDPDDSTVMSGESRRSFEQKGTILWMKSDDPSFDFKQTIVLQ